MIVLDAGGDGGAARGLRGDGLRGRHGEIGRALPAARNRRRAAPGVAAVHALGAGARAFWRVCGWRGLSVSARTLRTTSGGRPLFFCDDSGSRTPAAARDTCALRRTLQRLRAVSRDSD
jgi:hypothetical protein